MGNWINNSRPPYGFPNFFISICLANMCWLAGFSYLNNWLWRIRKSTELGTRRSGSEDFGILSMSSSLAYVLILKLKGTSFLTSILLPNPRTQTITWVTIFSNLPRMLHDYYHSRCTREKLLHYVQWMPEWITVQIGLDTVMEIFSACPVDMVAISQLWPWSTWNVTTDGTEEVGF